MNPSTAIKSGFVMLALVAALATLLTLALPTSFFKEWGWLSGPAAMFLCAFGTSQLLGLPVGRTLLGVLVAAVPGLLGVLTGLHWLGTLLAVITFALWCGFGPAPRRIPGGR